MARMLRFMPQLLLLISSALVAWGVLGLVEYGFPEVSLGLQHPNFPAGTQFLHFFAILVTGLVFLMGYYLRWSGTPFVTVTMYAVLATLCFVETVDFGAFGGGARRFIPVAMEYCLYVALSVYLLRSPAMHQRFSSGPSAPDPQEAP